jgi:hypothetical protein
MAIEEQEPRVAACVSAHDLPEYVSTRSDGASSLVETGWSPEFGGRRYWMGCTDYLCFAWSEPDWVFWNPVTERLEDGWRIVPPELCLKNRPPEGAVPMAAQVQPQAKGPLRPAEHVLFGRFQGQLVIGDLNAGRVFGLAGASADMWGELVAHGTLEGAAAELLAHYDTDEATLQADLRAFAADLQRRGLLEVQDVPRPNC